MLEALESLFAWSTTGLPAFLVVITVVVFFHELGHFAAARAFGVRVKTFSIGFGPEIFGWTDRRQTRWKVSWIPLGGYVQFAGDANAASQSDPEAIARMSLEERHSAFALKPLYQRALVIFAGPAANFVLAIVILAVLFMTLGQEIRRPVVSTVTPDTVAAEAGFRPGDVIVEIDGRPIESFAELQNEVLLNSGVPMHFLVARDGTLTEITATPRVSEVTDRFGNKVTLPVLGIANEAVEADARFVRYGLLEAVGEAAATTWKIVETSLTMLWRMVTGGVGTDQVSGPLGIAKLSGDVAGMSILALINLIVLISISVGLINLFPIPVLDGGHLLYYAFEAVLGRPLGERAQELGFRIGIALVLTLMIFATWNDLLRFELFK